MRVGLPGGLDMRAMAMLGQVTHDLRHGAGTGDGNGEFTAGNVPDDDEQRGRLAVEHGWVVPVVRGREEKRRDREVVGGGPRSRRGREGSAIS